MPSPLSFAATKFLRDKLLLRNLTPYTKVGVFVPTSQPATGSLLQNDFNVIDSPDVLIDANPFVNQLGVRNEFGPDGGYTLNIDGLINTAQNLSNQGPYGAYPPYTQALQVYSTTFQKAQYIKNEYTPPLGFIRYYDISDIIRVQRNTTYWEPPSFQPSSYSPFAILLQADPFGDNGPVSDDSRMMQIAAERAKYSFKQRVDQNVRSETIGRVNILNALQDPINLSQILAGRRPIVDRDWKITSGGGSILSQGQDIVQRIAGFTLPFSPIPGDYFDQDNLQRDFDSTQSLVRSQQSLAGRIVGGLFGLRGPRPKSPSQLFLDFTGAGQRAQLTYNLDFNRYRPQYNTGGTGIISALGNAILGGFARNASNGTYYVGGPEREPTYLVSPPGQIPVNSLGQQVLAPVYGPDILAIDFEGADQNFQFGLAGRAFEDDGNLSGGFSWVSPKWAPNAGKRQKPGGDYATEDPDFPIIAGPFQSTESIRYTFRPGSILDNTQRLVDSVPNTGARFAHVGNAIDQTSKVFFDGYKEITKGSQVIKYSDGQENVGIEYCRTFTKDTPYYTYNDLQKSDGNIRKSAYSVLDSTFNLNIAPTTGEDSTNIINGQVTKYMFSIENLAWRTGSRPGFRVSDLPDCEKGPNGGRVMWFPPYDLTFNEDTTADFNNTSFLGRPEPVYTYKSTSRGGTLKWKIIVDHPSILNLIVNKVLANEGDRPKVDSIVNSFFAGCKKYDLYELAKIYNTVPLTELQAWQEIINDPNVSAEQYQEADKNINTEAGTDTSSGGIGPSSTQAVNVDNLKSFENYAFYFDNDIPGNNPQLTTSVNYQTTYATYTAASNVTSYKNQSPEPTGVELFFSDTIEENFNQLQQLGSKIFDLLDGKQAQRVVLNLVGSASAPAEEEYNNKLSARRIDSVIKFFNTFSFPGGKSLSAFISNGQLVFQTDAQGEISRANPRIGGGISGSFTLGPFNCTQNLTGKSKTYSVTAMACRAVTVKSITVEPIAVDPQPNNIGVEANLAQDGLKPQPIKPGSQNLVNGVQPTQSLYKGASKKLLRYLLSECDYFQVMKVDNPFIYDSIKEKIKYFQPSFHSMTPEGLNSRLTFLQQCMRPGDTIPTIETGPNGIPQKKYNDAINTSFGAPPVLVLRVGDFYNTKVIPKNLSFNYDKTFDMNPEGIGFQPMIVDVSFSFQFVGGSGLKNPIDTLQNALTFNYYANTEMYDERAEATEDTSRLDKEIVDALSRQNPIVGVKNVPTDITTDGGNTIGIETVTGQTASGVTGTLVYRNFMNNLVSQTQGYFSGTLTFFDNILANYNYGILALLNSDLRNNRGYNTGTVNATTTLIYGKPLQYQTYVSNSFDELIKAIDGNDLPIFNDAAFQNPLITNAQKRLFKKNYKDYVNTYRSGFLNGISENISTLTQIEQQLVFNIDRINFVLAGPTPGSNGYDGKINPQNISVIYTTTGTTEVANGTSYNTYSKLGNDTTQLATNINDFLTSLTTADLYLGTSYDKKTGSYTPPTSENITNSSLPTTQAKLEYMMMSRALLLDSNRQGFVDQLKLGLDQASANAVDFYYNGLNNTNSRYNVWKRVNDSNKTLLQNYRTSSVGLNYVEYTPTFGTSLERTVLFSTLLNPPTQIKKTLQDIYSPKNNTAQTNPYNFKRKFN
jgi:hypothetical protein